MSRHYGVSCDSCLKGNFSGRRYKCLHCYDYDLCADCYDGKAATSRHVPDHPMQCILTRGDYDLYYGGECGPSAFPQAFTCPFCGKMGFTEQALQEHATHEHADVTFEVVCPICASLPLDEPNRITDDLIGHMALEHPGQSVDLISFGEETPARNGTRRAGQGTRGGHRVRRANMHYLSSAAISTFSSRSPSDPIGELLSQLSSGRRAHSTSPSQLQQLHVQMQHERQMVRAARHNIVDRLSRRQANLPAASNTQSDTQNVGD